MAELRLDLLDPEEQLKAASFPEQAGIPLILTMRRKEDGGRCTLSEKERRQILLSALDGDFSYIDIEEDIKRNEVEDKAREKGVRIIRSFHDFSGIPDDIYSRIYRLSERGDIAKAAVTPHTIQDLLTLFRISEELKDVPKIIIGMGDWGIPIRILYRKAGSLLTFACSGEAVAPGQVSAKDLKLLYRADKVDERTGIYGIIGNPVLHTSSPLIHNLGFHAINYNAIYLPFLVDNVRIFFALAEYLRMRGFSVTIPYIKPTIISTLLLRTMWIVNFPDIIYAMTNGGPVNSTNILATQMINTVFKEYDYGKGSAIGVIIMAILFVYSVIYLRLTKSSGDDV